MDQLEEPSLVIWMIVAFSQILAQIFRRISLRKEYHHHEMKVLLLKDRDLQDQSATAAEWGEGG